MSAFVASLPWVAFACAGGLLLAGVSAMEADGETGSCSRVAGGIMVAGGGALLLAGAAALAVGVHP